MKRVFLFLLFIVLVVSPTHAEITKSFDQFKGQIIIESNKSISLNEFLDMKVTISKSFFSNDGYKNSRVPLLYITLIPKTHAIEPQMYDALYWMLANEPNGHKEKWLTNGFMPVNSIIISQEFRKAINTGKEIFIKIPILGGKDIIFRVKPETLKEWDEVITFDAIKNPPQSN